MTDTLRQIESVALALPEAQMKPFGNHTAPAYRVRDKLFAHVYEDHSAVVLKAPKGEQAVLVESDPDTFFVPDYVGHHGWVGVWLGGDVNPDELAAMIRESYRLIAPKSLARQVEEPDG